MITQQIIEKLGCSLGILILCFLCIVVYLFGNTVLLASYKSDHVHSFL